MGTAGIILVVVSGALLLWLLRELSRLAAAVVRDALERGRQRARIREQTEQALRAPGATPELAVDVSSASVVEVRATADPCVVCGAAVSAERHVVETLGDEPFRVVWLRCRRCGHERPFYVRIVQGVLH